MPEHPDLPQGTAGVQAEERPVRPGQPADLRLPLRRRRRDRAANCHQDGSGEKQEPHIVVRNPKRMFSCDFNETIF